jgi:hypothetical protein
MVEGSLGKKKKRFLLIIPTEIFQSLNYVGVNLKAQFLIKSGYYIVPSPSTAIHLIKQNRFQQMTFYYCFPLPISNPSAVSVPRGPKVAQDVIPFYLHAITGIFRLLIMINTLLSGSLKSRISAFKNIRRT